MFQGLYNFKTPRGLGGHIYFKKRLGTSFSFDSITGLRLWVDASTRVFSDFATAYSPSSNSFVVSSGAQLASNTGDMTWAGWFYLENLAARTLMGKWEGSGREWVLLASGSQISGRVSESGNLFRATGFSTISAQNWFFISLRQSVTGDFIKLNCNDDEVTFTNYGPLHSGTGNFKIGAHEGLTNLIDGRNDSLGRWNRYLDNDDLTYLRNNASGRIYADLNDAIKVGMVSWWDMDENTATFDSHGSNNLITNNVSTIAGLPAGFSTSGDPVCLWQDISNNGHHFICAEFNSRPRYITNGIADGSAIIFDGVDDILKVTGVFNQPLTVYATIQQDDWIDAKYLIAGTGLFGLRQSGTSPRITLATPHGTPSSTGLPISGSNVLTMIFNGANSVLQVGNQVPLTGNAGTNSPSGWSLGAKLDNTLNTDLRIQALLVYTGVHNDTQRQQVRNKLGATL